MTLQENLSYSSSSKQLLRILIYISFLRYVWLQVFEYFASIRTPSGEVFMTPADLMRAVVPVFPPSNSNRVREGFLRGERVPLPGELNCPPSSFFMLFDTNSDGLISFVEQVLKIPISPT